MDFHGTKSTTTVIESPFEGGCGCGIRRWRLGAARCDRVQLIGPFHPWDQFDILELLIIK
jgi:hypothetical protein